MAIYRNYSGRPVTLFLNNSIPVAFAINETKQLPQENLEKIYSRYIKRIDNLSENLINTEKENNPQTIIEVKQPEANKEFINEPLQEKKNKSKRAQISEGYNTISREVTIASSSSYGGE